MGWDVALLAAGIPVLQLRDRFLPLWSKHELVGEVANLPDFDALCRWREENEVFVSAADWTKDRPGTEVKGIYSDGKWSVLVDFSYCICADTGQIAELSMLAGAVIVLTVGMHGGVAALDAYDQGRSIRSIAQIGGQLTTEGEPLPNEHGIDLDSFYLAGADALWRSFGLHSVLDQPPPGPMAAICVSDRTDYGVGADRDD
ncbi:MAG TPA: hypothetical protein VFJ30_10815 [Phycisphaerae bacterium]|nr:hypothetical protein [Phycisphaerae bacterium]